ncbi:uncharacterized protein LOC119735133 [Patiria miniata]|uniref:Ig-like domain-containing protein n=1 Tax=Patiria miniata TaxID=46514 RepID=A0A914AMV0_PATMI|nr:uncharacterized protein LOC119735133 [Patiria miniata]
MTSEAFTGIERNCSVDIGPTVISTDPSSVSATHDLPTTTTFSSSSTLHFTDSSPTNSIPASFSTLIIALSSAVGAVIIIFLIIVICLVSLRRKSRRLEDKGTNLQLPTPVKPGSIRVVGPTDRAPPPLAPEGVFVVPTVCSEQPPPQSISLHTLPSDTRDSANSSHSYETRIGYTVAELHPQEPDQRRQGKPPVTGPTVDRLQPQYTEDGYTQYIVEGNNGNQTTSNTEYMPLSAYEEATVTTSVMVTAPGTVSVRRGEPLQLSCNITMLSSGNMINTAQWDRKQNSSFQMYGVIDASSGCGVSSENPCPAVNTSDNRGIVRYERGTDNDARLTLTITPSHLEDSTSFQCVVYLNEGIGSTTHSAIIKVTIRFFPNTTYPRCFVSPNSHDTPALPLILTCSSEFARPNVSLLWTTLDNSTNVILGGITAVAGDEVENKLHLNPSWTYTRYVCHMTSEAFPGIERNCSVDIGPTTVSTDPSSVSTTHDLSNTDLSSLTLHFTDSSPTNSNPSSFSTVIIAVSSAVGGVIILLLVIIICLVSSRRKSRSWENRDTTLQLSTPTRPSDEISRQAANVYDNHNYFNQPASQRASGHEVRDAESTDRAPPAPEGAYAVSTVIWEQTPPPPVYAVLDPDVSSDDDTCVLGVYSYATVQKMTKPSHDGKMKQNVQKAADLHNLSTMGAYDEAGQLQAGGPLGQRLGDSNINGNYNDDDCTAVFVDNILYVASSDDALQL